MSFAVFSLSSLTPHDCSDGGRGDSHEQAGSLPAGWGCSWGCWGGTGRQQAVELLYGRQEQAADLEQICSWVVTQLIVQLALVFAASF